MANDYGFFFTRAGTVLRLPINPDKFPIERDNSNSDYNVLGLGPITIPRTPKQWQVKIEMLLIKNIKAVRFLPQAV